MDSLFIVRRAEGLVQHWKALKNNAYLSYMQYVGDATGSMGLTQKDQEMRKAYIQDLLKKHEVLNVFLDKEIKEANDKLEAIKSFLGSEAGSSAAADADAAAASASASAGTR